MDFRQPLSGMTAAPRPGDRAQVPSQQALAATLAQLTGGLSPTDVTTKNACQPVPGAAACAAQVLVLRSSHKAVHPRVAATRTFTQVFPSHARGIAPAAGGSSAASPPVAGSPGWIQQAYDLTYVSQTGGAGATVAIVDAYDDPPAEADLAVYRSRYRLPPCTTQNGCFTKVNENGQPSPLPQTDTNWSGEITLDLDAVSAVCPNCHILLVEAFSNYNNDLQAAIQQAARWPGVKQISNSWGGTSSGPPSGAYTFPGIATIASSGDWGVAPTGYQYYPAGLPGVTAAGGTALASTSGSATARGFGESAWSLSGGWGDSSGCNTQTGIVKPSYQTDSGCTGRSYADVSADAQPSTGLSVYGSLNGGWGVWGGTSLSSPLIAAYLASTGIDGSSPGWAYASSALLNDPVGGSDGTCPPAWAYICTAGVGYDGPTGIGSISGALVKGAPGIGGAPIGQGGYSSTNTYTQSVSPYSATLTGGVYPNGLDTTAYWQYGTTTSYGQQTAPVTIGSGQAPVLGSATLQSLVAGTLYHYRLVAQNSAGMSYGYDYTFTTAAASAFAPVNTSPPVITGTARQGQALSAGTGSWNPGASSFAYRWERSSDNGGTWTGISGATTAGYNPAGTDIGLKLRVTITATNPYGSASSSSAAVGPVLTGGPVNTGAPVISGQPNQVLTVSSSWNPAGSSYSYEWQRSVDGTTWTDIAGVNAVSYGPVHADEGAQLRVIVAATNPYGTASATSAAVGPVFVDPPMNSIAPAITGTAQRSYTLSANAGSWTGYGNSYGYQWQRSSDGTSWTNITAATATTYALGPADEGAHVRVLVIASNQNGTASTAGIQTQIIAPFPPANTVAPTVTGVAQRTYTLSATAGSWTGAGNSYTYQWQRDAGEGFEDIPGATGTTYLLTPVDEGTTVRIVVSATNPDATISEASQPTAAILSALPVNAAPPTISGSALRGSTLTGSLGVWTGQGNAYAWQWQRSRDGSGWTDIAAANTYAYTLSVADVGDHVRVTVRVANADGAASAASLPTAIAQATPPSSITLPTVSGTPQRSYTLTSAPGSWNGIGNTYSYQWQRSTATGAWTDISGANAATYTVAAADEGAAVRLQITASNPDAAASVASLATGIVQGAPAVNTSPPAITGTAQRGNTLSGNPGIWSGIGNVYATQWQESVDGVKWSDIGGATDSSYAPAVADEGMKLRFSVSAANPDGRATAVSQATAPVLTSAPTNGGAPAISGTYQRGGTLSSTSGSWGGLGNSYSYQWQRSTATGAWTDISGANAATYTVAVADEGASLRLSITVSNLDGSLTLASQSTAIAPSDPPVNRSAPAIAGTAQRSYTLTATTGTWNGQGNSYSYQWQHSGGGGWSDISGATSSSYVSGVADEGTKLRMLVTATNLDASASAASGSTVTVLGAPPVNTALPTITGTAQRSYVLTADPGSWGGLGNTYAYQWQRSTNGFSWSDIDGATATAYTLGVADEYTLVRVRVRAANPDASISAASAPSSIVRDSPPASTSAPTITGTPQRTFTLDAGQGTWTGIGNTYAYRWQRSTDGTTWSDIAGAGDTSYTLGTGDENSRMRVVATASNPDGSVSVPSAPTSMIQGAPPVNAGLPTISGTAQRSLVLSSAPGLWGGLGNSYAYQWQHSSNGSSWTDITGATDTSYTLGISDENTTLRVLVTATNPDGSASARSVASATVQKAPPSNTSAPTTTGTPQRGYSLSASQGTWTGPGNSYAYQWQRSTGTGGYSNVAGATDTSYALGCADENHTVRVVVTATNPDGSLSAAGAPSAAIAAAPPFNTSLPAVTGTPRVGAVLSTSTGNWSPAGASFAYQWQHGDSAGGFTDISGASAAIYTAGTADAGRAVRVRVTATNVDGSATAASLATTTIAQPPNSTRPPAAPSGTLMDSYKLTAEPGGWDTPSATFSYSWLRCPASATSADSTCPTIGSGSAYTLSAADIGSQIAVAVTATSTGGTSDPAFSALSAPVAGRPLTNLRPPSISGAPQVPQTLSAKAGSWSLAPSSVSYAWQRCDADGSSGCTQAASGSSSYTLSAADRNHSIVLVENVTSPGRTGGAASPPLTIQDQPLPQPTAAPTVSGTAQRASTLTASPGTWTDGPTLSYQWLRCGADGTNCQPIANATGLSYLLSASDEAAAFTILVSATNTSGTVQATAKPTSAVTPLLPVNTSPPVIKGASLQQGVQLGIVGIGWQATTDTTFKDSWQRCSADGSGCQTIPAAASGLYIPTSADVGHALVATVTATNIDGSVNATSAPTSAVLPAGPRWRSLPTIGADNGAIGGQVAITPGSWSGPAIVSDLTQMMRCTNTCTPTGSANADSYQIADPDLGAILRVRETASNSGGATVVWSARYVGPVSSPATASAVIATGQRALRNSDGDTLATAQLTTLAGASAFTTMTAGRVVKLRRARGVSGKLKAWVCPLATTAAGAPSACTSQVTVRTSASLQLPASMKGKLRVVVVRRGR